MSARIGKLRHRLTIERQVPSPDGGGGAAIVWEELAEIWGAVEAVSGRERIEANRTSGEVSQLITIRHRSDLGPAMRFRRGAEIFEILAVLDRDGRGRFLQCHCERRFL
jgi:SPP1 family predicted phage head-tail adaptor